jgi:hypothetical protein
MASANDRVSCIHSSNLAMTTTPAAFTHPSNPALTVRWDELTSDAQRNEIADLFRSRFREAKARSKEGEFDAEAEYDKVPAAVRDWDERTAKEAEAKPKLLFRHPLDNNLDVDWNALTDTTRVVVAGLYESAAKRPKFIRQWVDAHQQLVQQRLAQDLLVFSGKDCKWLDPRPLDLHRQLSVDSSRDSIKASRVGLRFMTQIFDQGDADDYFLRRERYDVMLRNTASFQQAKKELALLLNKEDEIMKEARKREQLSREKLEAEHQAQLRAHDKAWLARHQEFTDLVAERTEEASRLYDEALTERARLMALVHKARVQGIVANLGVNTVSGSAMSIVNPGAFRLSDEHVRFLIGDVFPLLVAAVKDKGTVLNVFTKEQEDMGGRFLSAHDTWEAVRHVNVSALNNLLDHYGVVKPRRYLDELAWLGSGLDNFQEWLIARREKDVQEMQMAAVQSMAKASTQEAIRQQSGSGPPVPPPRPQTTKTATTPTGSGSSSSSSASASPSPSSSSSKVLEELKEEQVTPSSSGA